MQKSISIPKSSTDLSNKKRISGFTLFELIFVIAILGAATLIVFPKIPQLDSYFLDSDARKFASIITYLDEASFSKKVYYKLRIFPDEESIKIEFSNDGLQFKEDQLFKFSDGIDIADVVVQGLGKIYTGEVALMFNPSIGAEAFNIHLNTNIGSLTISYNPYSGKIKIVRGYV